MVDKVGAPDPNTVVFADLNEGMLTMARSKAEQEELSIEWHACDAAALSVPDGSFDVALCQWGLEFFSDRSQGLHEITRVLIPGGRLVYGSGGHQTGNPSTWHCSMLLSDIWGQERVGRSEPRLCCRIGRSCAPWSPRLGFLGFTCG